MYKGAIVLAKDHRPQANQDDETIYRSVVTKVWDDHKTIEGIKVFNFISSPKLPRNQ